MLIDDSMSFIKLDDMQYPLTFQAIKQQVTHVSFGQSVTTEFLENLGYAKVEPTEKPQADVVTETVPTLVDGVWTQTWDSRSYTEEELSELLADKRSSYLTSLKRYFEAQAAKGFPHSVDGGPVFHVQLRPDDRTILIAFKLDADMCMAAGITDPVLEFRSYENTRTLMTPQQASDLAIAALSAMRTLYKNHWTLKDGIIAATDLETMELFYQERSESLANGGLRMTEIAVEVDEL